MKMKSDYTLYNQSSIQNYSSIDNVDQAVEYLKDPTHFRSFGQGLTELLQKKNAKNVFSPFFAPFFRHFYVLFISGCGTVPV